MKKVAAELVAVQAPPGSHSRFFLLGVFPSCSLRAVVTLPLGLSYLFLTSVVQFTRSPSWLSEAHLVPWSSSYPEVLVSFPESATPLNPLSLGCLALRITPEHFLLVMLPCLNLHTALSPSLGIHAILGPLLLFLEGHPKSLLPSHMVHSLREFQIGRGLSSEAALTPP